MSNIVVKLPYIVMRDGRPRWVPGPRLRRLGFRGEDLRHDDGRWFTVEECRNFSEQRQSQIAALKELGRSAMVMPPRRRGRKHESHVYFLRCGDLIKIGFSTQPVARIKNLKTAIPGKVDSLVVVPGTRQDEAQLHTMLRAHRRHGEWFAATAAVINAMVGMLLYRKPAAHAYDLGTFGLGHGRKTPQSQVQ